ncbi:hypothetical protein ABBQ32_005478 [Trebouxia sp. C0010 RCD-2024]
MSKRFARFNTLVVDHLVSRLDRTQKENFSECRLFDSDGSKYLLQREQEDPNKIRLSFSLAEFAANIAVAASLSTIAADLSAQHHRYCEMCTDVEGSYQLVLTIQLDTLQSENPALQLQYLQSIGCIRADILCWPLRQALLQLRAGEKAQPDPFVIYSKPAQPIIVKQTSEECVCVFPIYVSEGSSKAYTNAFVQGFAETRRLGAGGDAPQCSFTSGPAPVPVPQDVRDLVRQASGGFVSIVLLPRHVIDTTLDELTWTLLTLQDHVHYHVKCFKALIHSRMRKRMQSMILELGQAKAGTREVLAAISTN